MPAGRPLKYKSVKDLQRKINEYFASCWEEVWKQEPIYDEDNKKIMDYQWVQCFDRLGNPVMRQIRPYTITGLALFLETSRETLINYEEREEFFDTIKRAKDRCENYLEEGTLTGNIPPAAGIFGLKNYGWSDKQELEHSGKDGAPPFKIVVEERVD